MTSARRTDRTSQRGRSLRTFDDVVADFIAKWRQPARDEQRWFANQPSLRAAITVAGMAEADEHGKRLNHQRRIPVAVLEAFTKELLRRTASIRRAADFHALHDIVSDCGRSIHGIGDLTAYDAANHIGAFLKKPPKRVYLHAGVRQGAKAFHPAHHQWLLMSELPTAFHRLTAGEAEDCLCIYKRQITAIARQSHLLASPSRGC